MKNIISLFITILSFFSYSSYAQQAKLEKAENKYEKYAYIDAIKTYERVVSKGYESATIFENLGNAYYFNAQYDQAAKWYGKLFSVTTDIIPEYYYRFAHCLRSVGENDKANEMLKVYNKKSTNTKGELYLKEVNYLEQIDANSGRYTIEDAGINSKYSDYGSSFYNNKLVFTSARDTGSLGQRKHTWTNQYFTNLYFTDLTGDSLTTGIVNKFSKSVKSKFNESSAIFTKDGSVMYFTRNNYLDGKRGKDADRVTLIKIYKATFVNNHWTIIVELPFNSDNYSTAHPALSPDEKTLYFVSDMPGKVGQSDIFKVSINTDGSYGTPENLGKTINTGGKETFPFVTDENEIYFASDGHSGIGGLDIFVSKINPDGTYDEVQNVGRDVNSQQDDFAYLIDTKTRIGFFSSNREGGKGYDDIYKFREIKRLKCTQSLNGIISDLKTNEVLPNATVTLYDDQHVLLQSVNSDSKGSYSFDVECKKTYSVRAEKEEYSTNEKSITIAGTTGKTELNLALEKALCKVAVGDDLGKCFDIKWIYFDLNKSTITPKAAIDLAKILDVMREYPEMKIDIRSHADSRASFKYNEILSTKRAQSTRNWLIENGISADRLTSKGYGETQLLNRCSDGVICTEEEHQQNRRSEFIISAL